MINNLQEFYNHITNPLDDDYTIQKLIDAYQQEYIEEKNDDVISSQMGFQAELAIELSDVIVFMTDGKTGLTFWDKDIALMLKKSKKSTMQIIQ